MLNQRASRCFRANASIIRAPVLPSRRAETALNPARRRLGVKQFVRHQFNSAGPRPRGMDKLRQAYKEHPFLLPFGFVAVFMSFLFLGYVNVAYFMQMMAYHNFPEPVAKELRKAIFYDKGVGQDPKKAFKHYKEALMLAGELKMNPFSDEYMGIRIRVAEFMEQHEQYTGAILMLEKEKALCEQFIEKTKEIEVPPAHRNRILKALIRVNVKLGKLYSNDEVDNPEAAQMALVTAVETLLRETQRRNEEGIKEGEEDWLNHEEIGASLEELGHNYLESQQPELAMPLFLQALSLCPAQSCHSAMLMNQISAALSLQRPGAVPLLDAPRGSSTLPAPSVASFRAQAKQWAEKALVAAQAVPPADRTNECDIACAVTTHNLAELADMSGDIATAKRLFEEAKKLSEAIKFEDGVSQATQALARLQKSIAG